MDEGPSPWHYNTPTGRIFDTEGFRRFEYENDKLTDEQYESAKRKLKISAMIMYLLPGCPCMFYGTEVGLHGYKDPFNRKCFPWDNMDMELLEFFKKLFKFRANCKLAGSKFEVLHIDKNILMFKIAAILSALKLNPHIHQILDRNPMHHSSLIQCLTLRSRTAKAVHTDAEEKLCCVGVLIKNITDY